MEKKYLIVAKYNSKYGLILYVTNPSENGFDLNNVYLKTLYYKGKEDILVGEVYNFMVIKNEKGMEYCFTV